MIGNLSEVEPAVAYELLGCLDSHIVKILYHSAAGFFTEQLFKLGGAD